MILQNDIVIVIGFVAPIFICCCGFYDSAICFDGFLKPSLIDFGFVYECDISLFTRSPNTRSCSIVVVERDFHAFIFIAAKVPMVSMIVDHISLIIQQTLNTYKRVSVSARGYNLLNNRSSIF